METTTAPTPWVLSSPSTDAFATMHHRERTFSLFPLHIQQGWCGICVVKIVHLRLLKEDLISGILCFFDFVLPWIL